uniref:DUF4262 domain-containing protein n=1 Tax=Mycobacterium tuberculosis TaxID=1773 RepID=Q50763_MYCTX|nr:hypothetical protein [Mycobacterium tuberculosis]
MRRKGAEMCWMCDHPEATAEEYLDEVYGIMLMHGWAVQHVECERRPFAYTVGLTRRGLPELVVTGLSPRRGQRLLNIAARRALVGDLLNSRYADHPPSRPSCRNGPGYTSGRAFVLCDRHLWRQGDGLAVGVGRPVVAGRGAADFDEGRYPAGARDASHQEVSLTRAL